MTEYVTTRDKPAASVTGGLILLAIFIVAAVMAVVIFGLVTDSIPYEVAYIPALFLIPLGLLIAFFAAGLYSIQQNEAVAITLFGNYKGTDRKPGLRWVLPWYGRRKISLRVRNLNSETLKVNDKRGNPIEIASVVVWRVVSTAQAVFDVNNFEDFVDVQVETALREIASKFAYDHGDESEITLRAGSDEVSDLLREKLDERMSVAGVKVDEARISHLAYAPEIASAMLRRQQADAILEARAKIVEGAVSMVETALHQLEEKSIIALDGERRAAMVSNLLVVLCGDRDAAPVVNAGSLYQ